MGPALPSPRRPIDPTPVRTADLPPLPQRDRRIPASAWDEAPVPLQHLGDDIGAGEATYLRRIGRWLLWRAGPPTHGDARYLAIAVDDLTTTCSFRLFADGSGEGDGPAGSRHTRFRTWKESLRDAG